MVAEEGLVEVHVVDYVLLVADPAIPVAAGAVAEKLEPAISGGPH